MIKHSYLLMVLAILGCDGVPMARYDFSLPDMAPISSPAATVVDGIHSGTRLVAAYYVSTDGAQVPWGFLDEGLGETPCIPEFTTEGLARCLPRFPDQPTRYFLDAACTAPLFARNLGPPIYMTVQTPAGVQVHTPSVLTGPPPASAFVIAGAGCQALGLPQELAQATLFTAGAVIDPASFVALQLARSVH